MMVEAALAVIVACSLFGYGFFLGWWAASQRLIVVRVKEGVKRG